MTGHDTPTAAERSDPERMWLDQVAGRRDFESCEFTGFLNDLDPDGEWQQLFDGLEGSQGFVARFSELLPAQTFEGDAGRFPYWQPLKRNALSPEALVGLAEAHVSELIRLATLVGRAELRRELEAASVRWIGERVDLAPLRGNTDLLGTEIYDFVSDLTRYRDDGDVATVRCLGEACYALTADPGLRCYLMSDFLVVPVGFDAYKELWVGGGDATFDERGDCVVTSKPRR